MPDSFYEIIPTQTDEQVREYIANRKLYSKECVEFAVAQLAKRGNALGEDEVTQIREDLANRDRAWEKEPKKRSGFWKRNIVTDESAPLLYSRLVVSVFTLFGTTIFGSILLSVNLKKLDKGNEIPGVAMFGLLFAILTFYLASVGPRFPIRGLMNIFGSWILVSAFWNRYVGKDTQYRQIVMDLLLLILAGFIAAGLMAKI